MPTQGPSYKIKLSGDDDCKAGKVIRASNSVTISVKQPAAQPLKIPPTVAVKPGRSAQPPSGVPVEESPIDFPPPPEELLMENKPSSLEDELDALTDILTLSLQNTNDPEFFGVCNKCRNTISGEGNGCTAMNSKFHVSCFVCEACKMQLTGMEFYCLMDTPYCENCYMNSLEDCCVCNGKITDRILKAVGNSYHPNCFKCTSCSKNLDGISFTLDASNTIHCVECYQLRFSPRCAVCFNLIMPTNERGETVLIISMDKSFHVDCYKCEDCDVALSSEDGHGCYPLEGHLLCQQCNSIRVQCLPRKTPLSSTLSTEL